MEGRSCRRRRHSRGFLSYTLLQCEACWINYEQPTTPPNLGFREEAVELAALTWFGVLGWRTLEGSYLAPDGPGAPRGDYREVVLLSRLEDAISRLNPNLGADGFAQVVRAVLNVESQDLLEQNRRFTRLLRDGVDVEVPDAKYGLQTRKARLIDFDDPEKNDFLAASQFVVIVGRLHWRFDIIAFVNGLPLAVLELKSATNPNVTLRHAFNQIMTYRDALPSFFRFNTAAVISDGMQARIGPFTADFDRFGPWRTVDGLNHRRARRCRFDHDTGGVLPPIALSGLRGPIRHFHRRKRRGSRQEARRLSSISRRRQGIGCDSAGVRQPWIT